MLNSSVLSSRSFNALNAERLHGSASGSWGCTVLVDRRGSHTTITTSPKDHFPLWPEQFLTEQSFRKEHRASYRRGTIENTLKSEGILPFDSTDSEILYLDKHSMSSVPSRRNPTVRGQRMQGKRIVTRAEIAQRRIDNMTGPPPRPRRGQRVQVAPVGYPTVKSTLETDSLMLAAPNPRTNLVRSGRPSLSYAANGDCRIHHRELIGDLNGSVAFSANSFPINAGLAGTFSWLSRIAGNYESYRFESLRFLFETESATSATGTVMLVVDYDPSDPAPTGKQQALSYRGSVRSAPWAPCSHVSISEDLNKRKSYFVRGGGLATGLDVTLYDVGNLYAITQGQAGATAVGELWVEYTVLLMTPRSLSAGGGNAVWGLYGTAGGVLGVYSSGNMPVTVSVSAPASPQTVTYTFNQPWIGKLTISQAGTGLTGSAIGGTAATVSTTWNSCSNGASTLNCGHCSINASQGQTVTVAYTYATLTDTDARNGHWFTQGLGAYQ